MPGNILTADTSFPDLEGKGSTEEKLKAISGYLYMLLEQLRYTLANLGEDNFNSAELDNIGKVITGPLTVRVEETEKGVAQISITVGGIQSTVQDLDGKYSKVEQTVEGISSTVKGLSTEFSTVKQTVDGLEISTEKGVTSISGDKVASGTITGSVLKAILDSSGHTEGKLELCYCAPNGVVTRDFSIGGVWLDDKGAGNSSENRYRMIVGTTAGNENGSNVDFSLKLQSAGNSNYSSYGGNIWIGVPKGKQIILTVGDTQWTFSENDLKVGGKVVATAS